MKSRLTIDACLVCAFTLCACGHFAQSPFAGTWKTNLDQSQFASTPFIFSVSNGTYDCASCVPRIQVKADGSDQPLSGLLHYTIAVSEIDSHTVKIVTKRDGKELSEQVCAVAEDARKLHVETTSHPLRDGKPLIQGAEWERIGESVPGANAISGSWRMRRANFPENALLKTFTWRNSELSMSSPIGTGWTAKLDGKGYPVKGSYEIDSVSLKQMSDRTIEATYKLGDHLIRVDKITVSSDGKTLTTVSESKQTGRIGTFVATKQE